MGLIFYREFKGVYLKVFDPRSTCGFIVVCGWVGGGDGARVLFVSYENIKLLYGFTVNSTYSLKEKSFLLYQTRKLAMSKLTGV